MGPALRGRRMPFASWLAGPRSQGPWSLWPRSAWKSPRASEAPWLWGSSSALSGSRTPVPKPDALSRSRISSCFARARGTLAACFFSARSLLENFQEICSRWKRFACDTPVKVLGLAARRSLPISANFLNFSLAFDFDQIIFPHRRTASYEPAAHFVRLAVGEQCVI